LKDVDVRRICLFVHGIGASTANMVEQVWSWVEGPGKYDLCLTFDYESIGTTIQESARILANSLLGLGLSRDDGVTLDVVSHSMGAMVVRALVEIYGGDAYVDRVYMGGAPNTGSRLIQARKLIPWLGNVLVNLADSVPPALIAHWVLGEITDAATGLVDLDPGSDFYKTVNDPKRPPVNVPYYVQVGDNASMPIDWSKLATRLMRLADFALDLFFGSDHDLVISVESALGARDRIATFNEKILPINHFQYFRETASQDPNIESGKMIMAYWLSDEGDGLVPFGD
jgi:pimeloyl-ACP methyl ester carboxylesterase